MSRAQPAKSPDYQVCLQISPTHHVPILGSFASGLYELQKNGEIVLELSPQPLESAARHIALIDIINASGTEKRRIAIDYFDRSDFFCESSLQSVNVYFKRNFLEGSTASLSEAYKYKVRPAGITFACSSPGSRRLLAKIAFMALRNRSKYPEKFNRRRSFHRLIEDLEEIRCFLGDDEWQRDERDNASPRVVFQTRVWRDASEASVDRAGVNTNRIELARNLRQAFGFKETVGLLDTETARILAPDAILQSKVSRKQYAHQLRTSLIAVNSHGLDGSAGFKLAESLAAGCAIVSERLRVELPKPLRPDVHYLDYETPDECIAKCKYLLNDREAAESMRATNLEYYRDQVRPIAMARNLLRAAFE